MLWSLKNNILFLQIPKTGTTSLRMSFIDHCDAGKKYERNYTHYNLIGIHNQLEKVTNYLSRNPFEFDHYTFYRSPLDRFYSCCGFALHQYNMAYNSMVAKTATNNMYENTRKAFNIIFNTNNFNPREIKPDDFFDAIKILKLNDPANMEWSIFLNQIPAGSLFAMWEFFKPQVGWYITEKTNLLDFRCYNDEYRKMCSLLEINLPSEHILIANRTQSEYKFKLSKDKEKEVIDFYSNDYEFFINKGIVFDD